MSLSAEIRAKISASMKGNRNAKGHRQTLEHRRKLSLAGKGRSNHKGWKHTEEAKAKISASLAGHYASPKARENLRIAQRVIKLFRPEVHERKAALSRERMKAQMQDPAFVGRVREGQRIAALTRFSDME